MRKLISCIACGIQTAQGGLCVLCSTGITRMQQELVDLLEKSWEPRKLKKLNIGRIQTNMYLN